MTTINKSTYKLFKEIKSFFDVLDQDKDGYLDRGDLYITFSTTYNYSSVSLYWIDVFIKKYNKNSSGKLDVKEFISAIIDLSKQGIIDRCILMGSHSLTRSMATSSSLSHKNEYFTDHLWDGSVKDLNKMISELENVNLALDRLSSDELLFDESMNDASTIDEASNEKTYKSFTQLIVSAISRAICVNVTTGSIIMNIVYCIALWKAISYLC